MCKVDWVLVIQFIAAIGSVAVAIAAIWGNLLKSIITPPKLKIVEQNLRGEVTELTVPNPHGQPGRIPVIYYHLKVVNSRTWSTARNCEVLLTEIHTKLPNGEFQIRQLNSFPSFVWTPAEFGRLRVDISHDQIFDFGRIVKDSKHFEPLIASIPNNFNGYVKPGSVIRFALKIRAEGYLSKMPQIFEVAWDGNWTDNLDVMAGHLTITEIK